MGCKEVVNQGLYKLSYSWTFQWGSDQNIFRGEERVDAVKA